MRLLAFALALLVTPALAQQGPLNPPPYAGGIVNVPAGGTVVTKLVNRGLLPGTGSPNDLTVQAQGTITNWTIDLPNPTFDGQNVYLACVGGGAAALTIATTDGSIITSGSPTSCSAASGIVARFQYSSVANTWTTSLSGGTLSASGSNTFTGFNTFSGAVTFSGSIINQTEDPSGNFNLSANNLIHWRAAVSRVKSGLGRGKLLVISDSTATGTGAGSSGSYNTTGAYPYNWVTALSKQLSSFVATNDNTFFGDQNIVGSGQQTNYNTYDTRVTVGGGWSVATGLGGLGANFYTSGSAGTLAFTPSGNIDSVTIWYTTSGGLGTFTTNFDGGSSLGTINQGTGGTTYTSTTYTTTSGTHTYNVVWASGTIYFSGEVAYLSTTPAIDLYHSGWFSAYASSFNTSSSPWNPIPAIQTVAPDLTIIALTINDSNNGTTLSSYQTNMQAIITAAKASGDCLLVGGAPSNTTQAINGTLATFLAVNRTLALSNGCDFIDIPTRWVSYANTNPVMAYYDSLHPGKQGYQDIAVAIADVLSRP